MSIETTLERIAVALEVIANVMNSNGAPNEAKKSAKKASPVVEQLATPATVAPVSIPVAPEPTHVVDGAVQQPVVPVPVPTVPDFMGTATPVCPIADQKGLLSYVMSAYQEMGPEKGALIQDILSRIGAAHLNDVKPEHYPTIYAGVEALKAS